MICVQDDRLVGSLVHANDRGHLRRQPDDRHLRRDRLPAGQHVRAASSSRRSSSRSFTPGRCRSGSTARAARRRRQRVPAAARAPPPLRVLARRRRRITAGCTSGRRDGYPAPLLERLAALPRTIRLSSTLTREMHELLELGASRLPEPERDRGARSRYRMIYQYVGEAELAQGLGAIYAGPSSARCSTSTRISARHSISMRSPTPPRSAIRT